MRRAIELAQEWPHTHPNPRVGAVVVGASGEVVGEGWHRGPGTDHAEIVALSQAGDAVAGATIYVTLEPCSHHGQTPPCSDALIEADVATVVIGAMDPDSSVSGDGSGRLRDAGIEVVDGVLKDEARAVDPAYFRHRETGLPLVTIKWAMTLDGSIAAADGSSRWISGEPAREHAHRLRSLADAVVVGAGTVRADDPRLDVRLDSHQGPQPRPVILAGDHDLPRHSQLWERDPLVVSSRIRELPSGELLEVPGSNGLPDPVEACRALAARGLLDILLEGGPTIAASWWAAGVVTRGYVYVAPKIGGGAGRAPLGGEFSSIGAAHDVEFRTVQSVGDDVLISFEKSD